MFALPNRSDSNWFVTVRDREAPGIRLFCFPFAGGGASIYREWGLHLPPEIEVCAIQYPGRENRIAEQPIEEFEKLVREIGTAIEEKTDLPFAFFGHSLGAKVSFETARYLERVLNKKPEILFVSGARAPHFPVSQPIHQLDDRAFTAALQRYQGTPKAVLENEEIMQVFLPMIRADFVLDETFCSDKGARVTSPIVIFAGKEDQIALLDDVRIWERYTSNSHEMIEMEGGHFFLKDSQEQLLKDISEKLMESLSGRCLAC